MTFEPELEHLEHPSLIDVHAHARNTSEMEGCSKCSNPVGAPHSNNQESPPIPKIIAIVQQGRFIQMVGYLMSLAERAALAAEREAAKAKPKKGKRATKKRRARRE